MNTKAKEIADTLRITNQDAIDYIQMQLELAFAKGNRDGFTEGFSLGQNAVTQTFDALNSLLKT